MSIFKRETFYLMLGWVLTLGSLIMLYRQGIGRSYFHQDDVVGLGVVAVWKGWDSLKILTGEHIIITFWLLQRILWVLFGLSFAPYLTVNMLLHVCVLVLTFILGYRQTKSFFWSSLPVWGMVINPNWFCVTWWVTGQMVIISTLFAQISYWFVLKVVDTPRSKILYLPLYLFSVLPGLSWGVGLSWPIWPLLVYGIDYAHKKITALGATLILAQATLAVIYFSLVGKNLSIHTDPHTWFSHPLAIINFTLVGVSNTLVGRWLWPPENFVIRVVCLILALLIIFSWRHYWSRINRGVTFGILVAVGSFLTFAIPRWTFGIGHAMANYFAYFPLPFLLVGLVVFLSRIPLSSFQRLVILSVFLIHIPLSWLGFEEWAREWVIRPQQTRAYFQELNSLTPGPCIDNRFIPEFIVPQNIWHLDYLWPIFQKDFSPFCLSAKVQTW